MEIKRLSSEHYDQIIELWNKARLDHRPKGRDSRALLTEEMSAPHCGFIGMFDEERLIGVVIGNWDGRRGWINRLAIRPDYRGSKLGGKLLQAAESFLREQGAIVFTALIEENNIPSSSCFEKEGYVVEDSIKYYSKRSSQDD
ncbi:MAG: GNAT family N-acetyltransferase [candidate division Zixibacteria bacterium]